MMLQSVDLTLFIILILVCLLGFLYWTTRLPTDFPPGPVRVPVFGNLHLIGTNPGKGHKTIMALVQTYGPVVGLKFGSYPTIILSGLDTIREAFVKQSDQFSDRPCWLYFVNKVSTVNGKVHGLVFSNGEAWRTLRRFTLTSLKDFGVGKQSIDDKIQEEADIMCTELLKYDGLPADVAPLLQQAVSNIICTICFGSRFRYDNPEFTRILKMMNYNSANPVFSAPVNFVPLLQLFPNKDLHKAIENDKNMKAFIRKQIAQHRETFTPGQVRDFVDLYLEQEITGDAGGFSAHDIEMSILNLFVAGTETTSTSLSWLLLYLIHHPDVQKKCHQELDRVVGTGRRPKLSDRSNMPYITATIQEMQRIGNVAPMGLPHSVKESTTLCGYTIPKNTIVMPFLYSVHMDPDHWENPEAFRPERWIGPDGKLEKKNHFIPFSVGPRMCLGDMMAKNELFIFFTFLLQKFSFKMVDAADPPSLEGFLGVSLEPAAYKMLILER